MRSSRARVARATHGVSKRAVGLVLAACVGLAAATFGGGAEASIRQAQAVAQVDATRSRLLAQVDPAFLSFAIDIVAVTGGEAADPQTNKNRVFPPFDFTRPALRRLTAALVGGKPAYLRISGTDIDKTYYDMSGQAAMQPPPDYRRVLTRAQWDAANRFAQDLGLKVVVGINAGPGPRDLAYNWLPDNARTFLEYTRRQGYPLAGVEFGNEPNVFWGTSPSTRTWGYGAREYARDVMKFEALRRELVPQALFIGPGPFLTPGDPQGERPITLRGAVRARGLRNRRSEVRILSGALQQAPANAGFFLWGRLRCRGAFSPLFLPKRAGRRVRPGSFGRAVA